jgi:transcriptional regulator with XRE-family HTH domain
VNRFFCLKVSKLAKISTSDRQNLQANFLSKKGRFMTEIDPSNTNELIEKIGKRIFLLRKKRGMSREDLAFKIGVCTQQLFKYEIGENRITVDRLILVALALDLKIINFFPVDDVGEKIGLPTLTNNEDYKFLEHFAKLKNFSGEDILKRLMELITK